MVLCYVGQLDWLPGDSDDVEGVTDGEVHPTDQVVSPPTSPTEQDFSEMGMTQDDAFLLELPSEDEGGDVSVVGGGGGGDNNDGGDGEEDSGEKMRRVRKNPWLQMQQT